MPTLSIRRLRGAGREAHARAVLKRFSRSGLSRAAFGRREGISPVTLARWRREFPGEGGLPAGRDRFLEVRLPGPVARGSFELALGEGRSLRVPPGFDADDLRRLLEVLCWRSGPC